MLYLLQFVSQSVWLKEKALLPSRHLHLLVSLPCLCGCVRPCYLVSRCVQSVSRSIWYMWLCTPAFDLRDHWSSDFILLGTFDFICVKTVKATEKKIFILSCLLKIKIIILISTLMRLPRLFPVLRAATLALAAATGPEAVSRYSD